MDFYIEWMSDSHNCETCGYDYAQGAVVTSGGEKVIDLLPYAHCFNGQSYTEAEVYQAILRHLGHNVTENL